MDFFGLYSGRVVDNKDPQQVGQVKVRVPIVHGFLATPDNFIDDSKLPWALPLGLPAGGTPESGGVSWLPNVGDQVWVQFLDGEIAKPVWTWGNQNVKQRAAFSYAKLHAYDQAGVPVRRSALTRFFHWFELLPAGLSQHTKSGYKAEITDEQVPGTPSGFLRWTTALGYLISLEDLSESFTISVKNAYKIVENSATTLLKLGYYTAPKVIANLGRVELGGNFTEFLLDATVQTARGWIAKFNALGIEATKSVSVKAADFAVSDQPAGYDTDNNPVIAELTGFRVIGKKVLLGNTAVDPVVRLSDLQDFAAQIKLYIETHTHEGVTSGSEITSPPVQPIIWTASGSEDVLAETTSKIEQPVA